MYWNLSTVSVFIWFIGLNVLWKLVESTLFFLRCMFTLVCFFCSQTVEQNSTVPQWNCGNKFLWFVAFKILGMEMH
jgi:DMSO reductase anchor subunit